MLSMGHLLRIEKWAENLDEATLSRWLKGEGDCLEVGDSLCEIITDKATFEYEMEFAGTLRRLYAAEKSVVPVGYVIAFVGEPDEPLPEGVEEHNRRLLAQHQVSTRAELDLAVDLVRRNLAGKRVRATPAARRVARENGVDLGAVAVWLGRDKVVEEGDIQQYLRERESEHGGGN